MATDGQDPHDRDTRESAGAGNVVQFRAGRDYEPYLGLSEVADRLGYSERWVRDRIKDAHLPAHQRARGNQYWFLWSEVERWWRESAA